VRNLLPEIAGGGLGWTGGEDRLRSAETRNIVRGGTIFSNLASRSGENRAVLNQKQARALAETLAGRGQRAKKIKKKRKRSPTSQEKGKIVKLFRIAGSSRAMMKKAGLDEGTSGNPTKEFQPKLESTRFKD